MLTEAVCAQHQPRRLEEGRHAAENGRECKRKREEPLLSEWGGGDGFLHHSASDTPPG